MEPFRNPVTVPPLFVLACLLCPPVQGQQDIARVRFTTLSRSTPDGLESDEVRDIATGRIAVADGPLASIGISSISAIGAGPVWVGTASGELHQWSQREEAFVWFNHHPRHADSLADDHVRAIF